MKKYIQSLVLFFKRKNKEKKDKNCKNGKHLWLKNEYWYEKDAHDNYRYNSKTEFSEITSWVSERFYQKCSHCGHEKETREVLRFD